jgi:hypothetical protein
MLALAAFAAPARAALTPYDVPMVTCESSTLTSITLRVCGGASGAPAGLTLQWKEAEDFAASGWADDGTLCKMSMSGQPSLQHPGKSRWELMPGECETIKIGDVNFDETGVSGTGCGLEALECGKTYVFRWFAHAGRGYGRSDWGGELTCSTLPCPVKHCTYSFGYWKNHGGPAACATAPVNAPNPAWCPTILASGMQLGNVTYTASQLCVLMNTNAGGNGLMAAAHQLIAAKLNLCSGAADCATLQSAIASVNAAIGNTNLYTLATLGCSGKPSSRPAGCGSSVPSGNANLTAYNEGGLCPTNCHASSSMSEEMPEASAPSLRSSWGKLKMIYR